MRSENPKHQKQKCKNVSSRQQIHPVDFHACKETIIKVEALWWKVNAMTLPPINCCYPLS